MIVDLKNLWVGDKLLIKSSTRSGTFAGISSDGRARILIDGKVILVKATNIELVPEPNFQNYELMEASEDQKKSFKSLNPHMNAMIDLHINVLAPKMENELPVRILDFQIKSAELFVKKSIESRLPLITIIHGKGEGVLKKTIEHSLKQFKEIRFCIPINDGGALEIWLD